VVAVLLRQKKRRLALSAKKLLRQSVKKLRKLRVKSGKTLMLR
jgi:hypothetical protein